MAKSGTYTLLTQVFLLICVHHIFCFIFTLFCYLLGDTCLIIYDKYKQFFVKNSFDSKSVINTFMTIIKL